MNEQAYLQRLSSYGPGHVVRARIADPARRGSWAETLEGTVLIADFSGFTRLSEALGEMGREGAVVLADILNRYFQMLIDDVALRRGGELIAFGGDGFTLLFIEAAHARDALAAGLEIQEAMALCAVAETPLGDYPLALRVGVATGPVFQALVAPGNEAEFVIGGATPETAVRLQRLAERGTVLASRPTLDQGGAGIESLPTEGDAGPGVVRVLAPSPARHAPFAWKELLVAHAREARPLLEAFVDPPVLPLIQASPESPRIDAIYAPATALFMQVTGVPFDSGEAVLPALLQLSEALSTFLHPLGTPLRKTDVSDEGFKMILVFGPPSGSESHIRDAALTANVIRTRLSPAASTENDTGRLLRPFADLQIRFGLATGSVWAGEVGSIRRREYSALGDAMNLASRLSDRAAPWEILCTQEVLEAARPFLPVEEALPLPIRGKAIDVSCGRILPSACEASAP